MIKTSLLAVVAVSSLHAFAAENPVVVTNDQVIEQPVENIIITEDLALEAPRWLGKSTGFLCGADTASKAERPATLEAIKAVFESATTDFALDNGLMKASFVEGEKTCRYSALMLADNATKSLTLVESRAFSTDGESACAEGKALLDSYFAETKYLYWGHPHHITVMIEEPNAAAVCGEGATHVGVDFVVSGRL